jgi:hypothetical protein
MLVEAATAKVANAESPLFKQSKFPTESLMLKADTVHIPFSAESGMS